MDFATWAVDAAHPVLATAIHDGHDLRPEVAAAMVLDDAARVREEDPHTGELASQVGSSVVVNRSRFEIDLNRERSEAVYVRPEDAWDLNLWDGVLDEDIAARSRRLHDDFYDRLAEVLDGVVARHGGFVVYDVHSYNYRRQGPDAVPDDPADSPIVNLGTGSLPPRWRPVADAFIASIRSADLQGAAIDARENVRFRGRELAGFVHDRYGEKGCALAIEFKKIFMDEWTGALDPPTLAALGGALAGTVETVWKEHQQCR
ncbi:MAG: N-formylglutamate amidohydrolase [Acidimicrobiia bacterium]